MTWPALRPFNQVPRVSRRAKSRHGDAQRLVDGEHAGLQELATGTICTDPAEVLVKMPGVRPTV